jgi:hypothetical protein
MASAVRQWLSAKGPRHAPTGGDGEAGSTTGSDFLVAMKRG